MDGACKIDRQNKKCSCAGNSGRRKNCGGTDKEEENKLTGPLAKKELPAERIVNGKKVRGRRRYDRQHYDKWTVSHLGKKRATSVKVVLLGCLQLNMDGSPGDVSEEHVT